MIAKILLKSLVGSIKITIIIFFLMVIVEFLEIKYNEKLKRNFKNNNLVQYLLASFMGIIPGCVATFAVDSLYMSGLVGFGAINAVMIATSGDEAFVMLSYAFDKGYSVSLNTVLLLFAILFVLGIIGGFLADLYKRVFKLKLCEKCVIIHREDHKIGENPDFKHFLKDHIWKHIIKKHLVKLFLWLFSSLFVIAILNSSFNLKALITNNKVIILFIGAIIGILPISGPNLFFLTLFAQGAIPFSILLTNSIVQDGHGSLPLLSFSIEDTIKIKIFNIIFGISIGLVLLSLGF